MKRIALAVALLVSLAAPAWAELKSSEIPWVSGFLDCDDALSHGCDLFEIGEFSAAFDEFATRAVLGNAKAQNNLGVLYEAGAGVPSNKTNALRWYREAAFNNLALAQHNLAALLAADDILGTENEPSRTEQNFVAAYMWLTLAANQGLNASAAGLVDLGAYMTPAEIEEAQGLAREWREKHGQ